ncbi:PD-(D/E)XK nuclease family protein [Pedobacter rhizosphaerae]|uniref:PD-(D/E)XK nuclease superfamily protein n=1 Tax=Pedobacter rhizosphaerae TaxID=390241 RepID=A0A1H9UAU7_9SPHI|nr:PD-(D/E)XK nuclease family protein [Pedobacter rhizosphaerae]SES06479.1 PD-(D/E)XK nuclease superfamily protein [Pedobacter rhizosphaerae]
MFNSLYKLYRNHSVKTPLEDFTTEAFVGVLKLDPTLLENFCVSLLGLTKEDFNIRTQANYLLKNDINCIVDIVIESENQLCFIENKVNSKEGYRQLERYSKVLDLFKSCNKETYLIYCTKNFEEKAQVNHKFKQLRWFQVAKFLTQQRADNPIKNNFLEFLKLKKMSQNLTITNKDTFIIENLFETIELVSGHLDRVKPLFIQTFSKGVNRVNDGFNITQIIKHKRIILYFKDILGENTGWSEIKYGLQLNSTKIYCGIWVDKTNSQYRDFRDYFLANPFTFEILDKQNGFAIELSESLNKYVNDLDGDDKILNWYKEAFVLFLEVMLKTPQLHWNTINKITSQVI